jgi:hypothetical protein
MPTAQREPLRELSGSQRTTLERIVRRNNERVDVVRRAIALLVVAPCSGTCGERACHRSAPAQFGACYKMRAVRTSGHAPGVRRAPPNVSANRAR